MSKTEENSSSVMTDVERQRIYGLEFKFIYHQFFREGAAFFFICFYYFIEYTRIQTIFPVLEIIPWGSLAVILSLLFMSSDKQREYPKYMLVFAVYGYILLVFVGMTYTLDSKEASVFGYVYLNWLLVFIATISLVTTERRFVFLLLLYFLWNFKMSVHGAYTWADRGFGFARWGVYGPKGFFENSGELGLQMAMVCILSVCFYLGIKQYLSGWRKWLMLALPVTSFMSVLASSNRGDQLALVAAFLWLAFTTKGKRLRAGLLVALVLGIGYLALPAKMIQRFSVAGEQSDYTSYTRETRWHAGYKIYGDNPVFGVGTGSWLAYYTKHFPREEGRQGWGIPHNSFIQLIGEHGTVGLIFIILVFGGMFSLNKRTRDMAKNSHNQVSFWTSRGFDAAIVAYCIGGSFMSVLQYPYIWVQAGMVIGLHVATKRNYMNFINAKEKGSELAVSHE